MSHLTDRMFRPTSIVLAASAALGGGSAFAQTTGDGADTSAQLEQIIVTAQRRSESLQDVPVAITALSAAAIERSGVQTSQDIAIATPGLTMTTTRNGLVPFLRGVGTQAGTTDGSVAVYVDNVYYASSSGAIFGLNNVERVEVLKGPQGTLFGRNATGGLVHVVTRDPSETPELKASVGYGNYDTTTGSLYATGGIAPGVSADIALYSSDQGEGWGRNLFLGNDVNLREEWAARTKLKAELGESTTVTLAGDYVAITSDIGSARQAAPGTTALGGVPPVGSIYDTNSNIPFDGGGFGPGNDSYQYGYSAIISHDLSDQIALTSTTAYRNYNTRSYIDNDLTPAASFNAFFGEVARSFQQEILLNGTMSAFEWTAGGIYYRSRSGYDPLIFSSATNPALNTQQESLVTTESFAFFGQGSYELTDSTTVTLGARYTTDRSHIESETRATAGHSLPVGTIIAAAGTDGQPHDRTHEEWSEPTWRVALDHKLTPDVLAYVSYSRGYKAGAFNPGTPPSAVYPSPSGDAVNPETLDAYEIGLKSDLLDDQLRLNGSAFYYEYKNIQLLQLAPDSSSVTIFNAGAARINGVELEAIFAPSIATGRLEFRVATSLIDAEYTELLRAPTNIPQTTPPWGNVASVIPDASGNAVIKTPEFSSTVGLDYTLPLLTDYEIGFNVNWQHNDRMYWEVDNRLFQSPTDIVNAQASFGRDEWRVRLWGRNLLDEEYISTVNSGAFGDGVAAAPPRTYGMAVDVKFGGE